MLHKLRKDKALMQVFIYLGLVLLFLIENNTISGGHNIHSKMDDWIPFIPIFVVPYFSWYALIAMTGVSFYLKSKQDLEMTFFSVNLCMIIGILVYIIYPNYQTLRPLAYASDFFSQWVKMLQAGDSPASVCPSLHVAVCISLYLGITRSKCFGDMKILKLFMIILTMLICASTVFIKQHSIIDVGFGALLSVVVYVFVYKFYYNPKYFPHRRNEKNVAA